MVAEVVANLIFASLVCVLTQVKARISTPAQAEFLIHNLKQAPKGISLYANSDEIEFMCLNQFGATSSPNNMPLKWMYHFIYLGSNITSTENTGIDVSVDKAWTVIDGLLAMWKTDPWNKIKWKLFRAEAVSVLL